MARRRRNPVSLKWTDHPVTRSAGNTLRTLTESLRKRMVRLPQIAAAPMTAQQTSIKFPTLPDDPREKAIQLLQVAAQVEHALLVQYLYAGYAFSTPNRDILDIAIEEMSHLMTVQNLLRLIGEPPFLNRQDFGPPPDEEQRLFPFDLQLEPVTHISLSKYVVAESPDNLPPGIDPVIMSHILDLATQGAGAPINRVATLYALLGAVFGSEQLLASKAATGDAWYVTVNTVASEAAAFYGGRDKVHLPDRDFDANAPKLQGSDADWDRSVVKPIDEFRVHVVANREQAVESLRDIGLQGEGPSSVATEDSHFKRFYDLFLKFFGPDGLGTNPPPSVSRVPVASEIIVDEASADPNAISHPDTVRWAKLSNIRYAILLGALELYLKQDEADREYLRGWCFAEMYAIQKLSQFLVQMQRSATDSGPAAASPFRLPDWAGDEVEWDDLISAFEASLALIPQIQAHDAGSNERARILSHLLSSDPRKLAECQARKSGTTVRTKADRARDILDWAAGTGDPKSHGGSSPSIPNGNQGRFWNLAPGDFKQTKVHGTNIIEVPEEGGDALLIEVLRDETMPSGRPPLDTNGPEFQFLEGWIAQHCPDEPA